MTYRFAIVGCGLMGARHAAVVAATPGYELVAVSDAQASSAQNLAEKFGVPARSLEELLADPTVHGLVLTVPSQLHVSLGLKALQAGKHIIMEKPLATTPEEGRKLAQAAKQSDKILAVIAQNRFSEAAVAVKQALVAGSFGRVGLVRASVKWYRDDPYYTESNWRGRLAGEGGGVLMNQAIHSTDMLIHFFGRPNAVVALCAKNRDIIDTEDTAAVLLKFHRSIIGTMEASTSTWPGFEELYEIHGDGGFAVISKGKLTQWKTRDDSPAPELTFPEPTVEPRLVLFQRQYANILEAMNEGVSRLQVTLDESLWVVETTRQMYETAGQLSLDTIGF
jgi:predicted dehydrogenase